MLTAHTIKILQSLDRKKFRQKYNLFLVEGNKTIKEIPDSGYVIQEVYSVNPLELTFDNVPVSPITAAELRKISFLQHPKDSVAVCRLKPAQITTDASIRLVLDGIQDPGNLGTIIRLADWFGIQEIVCSEDTADVYNPKVIQSSMGSFLRVNVVYTDLTSFLTDTKTEIIGTDMDGENLYNTVFPEKFCLVLGNEGNGIRPETEKLLTQKITIPRFGKSRQTESLNVSMAAGIVLGEIFSKKK